MILSLNVYFLRTNTGIYESNPKKSEIEQPASMPQNSQSQPPDATAGDSPSKQPRKLQPKSRVYSLSDVLTGELNWKSDLSPDLSPYCHKIDELEKTIRWSDCCHVVIHVDLHFLGFSA